MAQQNIDFGSFPDDPDADAIRTAFSKVQNNFNQLFSANANSAVTSINRTAGAGITVSSPTGNVVISANLACLQVSTSTLSIGQGVNGNSTATITSSAQTLVVDLPSTLSTSNLTLTGNANIAGNANVTGNLNATNIIASGTIYGANIYANTGTIGGAYLTGELTTAAQPAITSVGTLSNLTVTGNVSAGNISGNGSGLTSIAGANVTGFVPNANVANTAYSVSAANISGTVNLANYATVANSVAGSNVSGQVANATVAGTVYTNAQPNITSVGTLTSLGVTGNLSSGNADLGNLVEANFFQGDGGLLSNVTGLGTLSNLSVAGNIIPTADVTYDLGNATNRWNELWLAGNTIRLGNATISANSTAVIITNPGGGTVPLKAGGSNTQVQYNDDGAFGGNPGMVFNEGTTTFTANNFVATSTANLGAIANITITGGSSGNVLTTYGNGVLYWGAGGGGNANAILPIANGTSNIDIPVANGDITFGINGTANAVVFGNLGQVTAGNITTTGTGVSTITSNSDINLVTANNGAVNVTGGLSASGNVDFFGANVSLGDVANLHITGGSNGQALITDGNGVLSWANAGTGGGTNLIVQDEGTNLTTTANTLNFTGNGVVATNVGNVVTVNISHNGPAGNLYEVQLNSGTGTFAANNNFYYTQANGLYLRSNLNLVTNGEHYTKWSATASSAPAWQLGVYTPSGSEAWELYGPNHDAVLTAFPTGNILFWNGFGGEGYSNGNANAGLTIGTDIRFVNFAGGDPASGHAGIYFADGTYQYTAATGTSLTVQEEGTNVVATANTINFVGSAVTASNVGGVATITIANSGISGVSVQEEGTNVVATANTINFVGNGVTASNVGGVATITIDGGSNANVAGSNTQVQFNDEGAFGANSGFTFDKTTGWLRAPGNISALNEIHFGDEVGTPNSQYDAWGRLHMFTANVANLSEPFYGFVLQDPGNAYPNPHLALTNEQSTWNQALIIGDGLQGAPGTALGFSVLNQAPNSTPTTGSEPGWSPLMTLDYYGNFLLPGSSNLSNVPITDSGTANVGGLYVRGKSYLNDVSNVTIEGGTDGYFLQTDGAGNLTWSAASGSSSIIIQDEGTNVVASANTINFVGNGVTASNVGGVATITIDGSGTPGGSNTQVQFNDDGEFGANAGFTYDKSNTLLTANNFVATSTADLGNVGNVTITGGSNNYILITDGNGNLNWANLSSNSIGNIAAGGANTQVQYNDDGILGGNPGMTFNEGTTTLTANNFVATSSADLGAVGNVTITGGTNGYFLQTDGTGNLTWSAAGGGSGNGEVAGSNTQIQYNDEGNFGATAGFTFNKTTTVFTANNIVATSTANLGDVANVYIGGGNAFEVLATVDGNGTLAWAAITPDVAGANTQVQYNDNGVFGGNPAFTFDEYLTLVTANNLTVSSITNLGNVGNVHIDGGTANYVLTTDGAGNLSWTNGSGIANVAAAGSNTQVQYNDDGVLGGNPGFTFDEGLSLVTANNFAATSTANLGDVANIYIGGGNALDVLATTDGNGTLAWATLTFMEAAGANTQIQYNDDGVLGGNPAFTFDEYLTLVTANNLTVSSVTNLGDLSNVHITGGNAYDVIATIDGTGNLGWATITTNGAAGSNTQVQYNDDGVLGGNPAFTFNEGTTTLTANNFVATSTANLGAPGNITITGGSNGYSLQTYGNGVLYWGNTAATGTSNLANTANAINVNSVASNVYYIAGVFNTFGSQTVHATSSFTYDGGAGRMTVGNANISGTANVTGNLNSGNANLGNAATANFFIGSGSNLTNITGANVTGYVANATHANIADVANVASVANSVAGANVTGTVPYANYSTYAGSVINNAQANITSVGTLTGLTVAGVSNLSGVGNVIITGGTSGFFLQTNGSGNLSWANVANVTVANATYANDSGHATVADSANSVAGANVTGTVANATYAVTAGTANSVAGANVSGTVANATYAVTAGTAYSVAGANVSGTVANATYAVTAGTANSVAGANVSGQVANALVAGTVYTNAQPNITSVGTLTSLGVTGNITGGNLISNGSANISNGMTISAGGASITGAVDITGNIDVTGNFNVTGNLNYSNVTNLVVGDPLIYLGANNTGNLYDLGIVASFNDGTYEHTGFARDHTDGVWKLFTNVIAEPTTTIDFANGIYAPFKSGAIVSTGNITSVNANLGNLASANYVAGTLTTAAQPNITSVGTLTSLGVNGTVTAVAFTANTGIFTGNGSGLSALTGANVTGAVPYATVANTVAAANVVGQVANALVAGTVYTNAQPNITSVGTLTSLIIGNATANTTFGNGIFTATGNANVGNLGTGGLIVATGNITGGNLTTGGAVVATGNVSGGNLTTGGAVVATGNVSGGNITTSGKVIGSTLESNVATGTAPLVVASTTLVNNLNADLLDGFSTSILATANTVAVRDANGSITANLYYGNGSSLSGVVGSKVSVLDITTNADYSVPFVDSATSPSTVYRQNTGMYFNPSTNDLTVGSISGTFKPYLVNVRATTAATSSTSGAMIVGGGVGVAGNVVSGGNIVAAGYHIRSVGTGISAAGSTQGTATGLTKEINVVSTVASGAGVVLPTAVAGMAITITNTSANALLVYPATSAAINSGSANASYSQPAGATLQFIAPTTTQWYTVGATYA